jgi:predicted Ser/Thr protein kinase
MNARADATGEQRQVKLGRYEVVRELGKGAMGIVYLAKDPLIGRLVALKTIRPAAQADDDEAKEFQQRFVREAQAAGILNHPSIVTVHDIGMDEPTGVSFIAMEYVEGQNLKEVLAQGRPLSFQQAGDIIAQVAEALDFAHAKGIVHRDVKPANIILLDGYRAKITDFGIAKITSSVANLTTTGQFLGTPNYMAPEQIKGTPVDGRSDIFSLGICLYECLTRRKPFGGDSLTSISYKIVHEPFPPLHEVNPTIPEGFEDVVSQCLAKEPAKRYQRGKDMATALRSVLRGERPAKPVDPMLSDATIVTRDRLPTVDMPFPEADGAIPTEPGQPLDAIAPPAPAARPAKSQPAARPSVWRLQVPATIFFAIAGSLAAALALSVLALRTQRVTVPVVDTRAEAQHARERKLRTEGNRLLQAGHVTDAYDRYTRLLAIAPHSPAINALMLKLSSIRAQEEIGKQQLAAAQQKFNEGLALYNEKKFAEAIPVFAESFRLNPNNEATAQYLKASQQEDERVRAERVASRRPQPRATPATATQALPTPRQPALPVQAVLSPASLTTVVNSNVTDGYIMVRAGNEVVAHENLYNVAGFLRRRSPRPVNVTKEFSPRSADVDIWVVIPALNVNDHRTIAAQNFPAGVNRRLVVTFDPSTRRVDYQLN